MPKEEVPDPIVEGKGNSQESLISFLIKKKKPKILFYFLI